MKGILLEELVASREGVASAFLRPGPKPQDMLDDKLSPVLYVQLCERL